MFRVLKFIQLMILLCDTINYLYGTTKNKLLVSCEFLWTNPLLDLQIPFNQGNRMKCRQIWLKKKKKKQKTNMTYPEL